MARRQIIEITDDLDGSVLDPETVRTRVLTIDGREVTLDLSPSSSDKLDAALAPFVGPPPGFETFTKPRRRKASKLDGLKFDPGPDPGLPGFTDETPAAEVAPVEAAPDAPAAPIKVPAEETPEVALVTRDEAAEILGVTAGRIGQLGQAGTLVRAGKRGRAALFTRASVEAYAARQTGKKPGPKIKTPPPPRAFDPDARCPRCGEVGETDPEVCRYCHEQGPWTPAAELAAPVVVSPPPKESPKAPTPIRLEGGKIEPGVNVVTVDREDAPDRLVYSGTLEDRPEDVPVLTEAQLERSAVQWRDKYRDGLPGWLEFVWYPDVLGIAGMDLEIVETSVRNPERVEIAPETFGKGYPILRFHRGDATTALGLRNPEQPAIIAAYHGSLLENDHHRTGHSGGGGGGARKAQGLPGTVRQSVSRLEGMGVAVDQSDPNARTAAVTFKGNDLGKITLGATVSRQQVESDYQRVVRKVEAIVRRIAS